MGTTRTQHDKLLSETCQRLKALAKRKLYVRRSSFISSWHISCYLDGTGMILLKNPKKQGKNWKTLQPVVCDLNKKHNFLANIGVFQQNQECPVYRVWSVEAGYRE